MTTVKVLQVAVSFINKLVCTNLTAPLASDYGPRTLEDMRLVLQGTAPLTVEKSRQLVLGMKLRGGATLKRLKSRLLMHPTYTRGIRAGLHSSPQTH